MWSRDLRMIGGISRRNGELTNQISRYIQCDSMTDTQKKRLISRGSVIMVSFSLDCCDILQIHRHLH